MIYQEGCVYHIKDEYFEKVQDNKLMKNKENGTYRNVIKLILWLIRNHAEEIILTELVYV